MSKCLAIMLGLLLVVPCSGKYKYGAPIIVDTNDPGVVMSAKWAVQQLQGELEAVLLAERQLVAGLLYTIQLKMRRQDQTEANCTVKVWVRVWMPEKRQLLSDNCEGSIFQY